MTDTAITRLQNHLKCDLARKNRIGRACLLKRFSQWLWSVWMIDSPQTSASRVDCTDRTKATNYLCSTKQAPVYTLPAPEQPAHAPSQQDQPCQPCKACKAWGVPCDQMEVEYAKIADIIHQRSRSHHKKRLLVAIAGIPGSGKTTTAAAVAQILRSTSPPLATALLSMDGFHLPRAVLDTLPKREEAYLRRGAPWTFDAPRFVAVVQQLRQWADLDPQADLGVEPQTIHAPSFDHEAKDPVEDGVVITPDTSVVIIEGNYCLLNERTWCDVAQLVDYRIFVDTDLQEARRRVAKRHVQAGIEATLDAGLRRVDSNDYLNALIIREKLITPDLVVQSIVDNV